MYRLAEIEHAVRKSMSERLLSFAEALPRFRSGPISELQQIREHQLENSNQYFEKTLTPDGQSIILKQITLSFFYEFEEQIAVNKKLMRKFKNSPFSYQNFDDLEKRATRLDAAGWTKLGGIYRKNAGYIAPMGISVESMPECIELLHLSHLQLMPAISCLEVTIRITDKSLAEFNRLAQLQYLPDVLLNRIIYGFFRPVLFGYSISGKDIAAENVGIYIQNICAKVERWLFEYFGFKRGQLHLAATCPIYLIERSEEFHDQDPLEYAKERWMWLAKYGFRAHALDVYANERTLFSPAEHAPHEASLDAMFVLNESDLDYSHIHLENLARGISSFSVLRCFLKEARATIEALRFKVLIRLRRRKPVLSSFSQTTLALRSAHSKVRHVRSEFERNKWWFQRSLEGIGELEVRYRDDLIKFEKNASRYVEQEISRLCGEAELLDKSIAEQLEIENIAAMFGLQRRIFWLTFVAAIAGLVGVISVWDKLVNIWSALSAIIA